MENRVEWKEMESGEFRQWSTQPSSFARIAKLEFTSEEFRKVSKSFLKKELEGNTLVAIYGCGYDSGSTESDAMVFLDFGNDNGDIVELPTDMALFESNLEEVLK